MKFILYTLIFVGLISKVGAQDYTYADHLKTFVQAPKSFLEYSFSSPLIQKVSLSTKTDQFELAKQRTSLKANFAPLKARKYETEYIKWKEKNFRQNAEIAAHENLYNTTILWSNIYFSKNQSELLMGLIESYKEKEKLLTKIVVSEPTKIKSINETQLKILNLEVEKETKLYNLETQKKELALNLDTRNNIDFKSIENYIATQVIEENLSQLTTENSFSGNMLAVKSKIESNSYEYNIEKANQKKIIDYVELGLNDFDSPGFRRAYVVGIGFLFPASKKKNIKLAELELENNYLNQILSLEKQKFSVETENILLETKTQLKMFRLYEDFLNKLENKLTITKVNSQMTNEMLEIVLDNKILYAEKKIELNELHQKIVENYIKLSQLTLQNLFVK